MSIRSAWSLCVAGLILVAAPTMAESAWRPGASMNHARAGHTATLLPDGRVLVVGGQGDVTTLATAEVYDPASGTWRVTASMTVPRWGHSATLLPDGRVLVVGGTRSDRLAAGEIFDAVTETWTSAGGAGATYGHTATLLRDGRVLVLGGIWGPGNFTYEPATGTWSPAGALIVRRGSHTATRLEDGRVLVVGGFAEYGFPTDNDAVMLVEMYDPEPNQWSIAAEAPAEMFGHTATLLPGRKVLIAGGSTAPRLFDPVTRAWEATGPYETTYSPAAVPLPSGDVVIIGGQGKAYRSDVPLGIAQRFNAGSASWSPTSALRTARSEHTATRLQDGTILVAGGSAIGTALDSTELLDTEAPGSIGPGFTGSWFDPAQSGHGLFIQVLPGMRFFAAWLTFDPRGAPAWFLGVGTYSGNTATISQVEQPGGGRWIPNFDAGQVVHNAWGTLVFTFTDCNHGRVDFNSVAGFGSGTMDLTRITRPAGLVCP